MNGFSAGDCIRFGWETFKKRPWFLIGAYVLFFVVVGIITALLNQLISYGGLAAIIGVLARIVVELIAGMGMISFALKAHDDIEHVALSDLWHPSPFWKYTGSSILFVLISFIGLILLVVPGIIWGIMFGFATYIVIDGNKEPMEALRESKRITYGYKWKLFALAILSVFIVILGVICLLIGVLVAYPIVTLAFVHAFRELQKRAPSSASASAAA